MSDLTVTNAERVAAVPSLVPPAPPKHGWRKVLLSVAAVLVLLWSFSGVQANLGDLVTGAPQMLDTLSRMLPPDITRLTDPSVYALPTELSLWQLFAPVPLAPELAYIKSAWWNNTFPQTVLGATIQTIQMALAGSFLALLVAFPVSFLSARNTSPHKAVYHSVKLWTNLIRTIPDFTFALVFIAAIGLGPFAGAMALAFHNAAVLTKLFAESIEDIDEGVVEALKATGAGYLQTLSFAVVPQVMPSFISFFLYRFETNIRAAAVLGLIGAGGIGFIMNNDFRMFQYPQAAMSVVVLIVLVMAVDYMSAKLRRMVT